MTETKKMEEIALETIDQIIQLSEDWRITQKACELQKLIREKMIDRGIEIEEKIKARNIAQKKSK